MGLIRVSAPSLVAKVPSPATLSFLSSALKDLRISDQHRVALTHVSRRCASHQAQGRANGAKDGPGKRLGAKKTAGEYVIPGNILFKQRGTHWFPGDNCFMGRDHTIHAGAPGYVRYYRDPRRHPDRKYIGIVFEKDQTLPQGPNAVRRRKLGMLAYKMPEVTVEQETGELTATDSPLTTIREQPNNQRQRAVFKPGAPMTTAAGLKLTLRPGYQYRAANYEIGRAAELAEARALARNKKTPSGRVIGARAYPRFKKNDRFAAWRKSSLRVARNMERRAMSRRTGKVKK